MNIELNLTLRCQLRCPGCNRLCDRYPGRTEDVTLGQIQRFIDEAQARRNHGHDPVRKVKLVGGEPLLHPEFDRVLTMLLDAGERGIIDQVKVNTNGVAPKPAVALANTGNPHLRWMVSGKRQKSHHLPYLWSPKDLGVVGKGPCDAPFRCGLSLDSRGWLPCSAGIMVARAFGYADELYQDTLPTKVWGMEKLCRHCIHGLPPEWLRAWESQAKPPAGWTTPTAEWKEALERYEAAERLADATA